MSEIQLVNVTEELVKGLVSFILHGVEYQTFCHCQRCELDIIAIALNALPTRYCVSKEARDEVFRRMNTPENIEQINKEIIRAIHMVGTNPRH